jgi:hypothetical protein
MLALRNKPAPPNFNRPMLYAAVAQFFCTDVANVVWEYMPQTWSEVKALDAREETLNWIRSPNNIVVYWWRPTNMLLADIYGYIPSPTEYVILETTRGVFVQALGNRYIFEWDDRHVDSVLAICESLVRNWKDQRVVVFTEDHQMILEDRVYDLTSEPVMREDAPSPMTQADDEEFKED